MKGRLSIIAAFTIANVAATAEPANCFVSNAPPDVAIIQQGPPPESDADANYSFYPASMFVSMNLEKLNARPSRLPKYFWQWANHGPRPVEKGNIGPRVNQESAAKLNFSSTATADACTLAQTATVLGLADKARTYAARGPVNLTTAAAPMRLMDVCLVWNAPLATDIEGILLDYEVQDGRAPQQTRDFLLEFASLAHDAGRKVILYTNPLDAPTQAQTGIDGSNARVLMAAFDKMSIQLWSGNRQGDLAASFKAQMTLIDAPDPQKLFVVFELANTTLADAATARALVKEYGLAAILFWRNLAKQGGPCETPVNRKIACIAYGRCAP